MDDVDLILRQSSRVPDASLAKAGLARYQGAPVPRQISRYSDRGAMAGESQETDPEDPKFQLSDCGTTPYKDSKGNWRFPFVKRQCLRAILNKNNSYILTDSDFQKLIDWKREHGGISTEWIGHFGVPQDNRPPYRSMFVGKKISQIPAGDPSVIQDASADVFGNTLKMLQFVADPVNWAAIVAIAIAVPMVLLGLYKLGQTEPGQSVQQTADTGVNEVMNYLPGKKAITIVR